MAKNNACMYECVCVCGHVFVLMCGGQRTSGVISQKEGIRTQGWLSWIWL